MSKKEKASALTIEAIAKLKSGEILEHERGIIRKQGITFIVTNGDRKRHFDQPLPAFEFASITKEQLEKVVKEREKKVKESIKVKKHKEKVAAKEQAKVVKQGKRAKRRRGRRILANIFYVILALVFALVGFVVFAISSPLLVEVNELIKPAIEAIEQFTKLNVWLIGGIALGLFSLLLLVIAIKVQLHKTKASKALGIVTSLLSLGLAIAGLIYFKHIDFANFESSIKALVGGTDGIVRLGFIGVNLIHLLFTLSIGWNRTEKVK